MVLIGVSGCCQRWVSVLGALLLLVCALWALSMRGQGPHHRLPHFFGLLHLPNVVVIVVIDFAKILGVALLLQVIPQQMSLWLPACATCTHIAKLRQAQASEPECAHQPTKLF